MQCLQSRTAPRIVKKPRRHFTGTRHGPIATFAICRSRTSRPSQELARLGLASSQIKGPRPRPRPRSAEATRRDQWTHQLGARQHVVGQRGERRGQRAAKGKEAGSASIFKGRSRQLRADDPRARAGRSLLARSTTLENYLRARGRVAGTDSAPDMRSQGARSRLPAQWRRQVAAASRTMIDDLFVFSFVSCAFIYNFRSFLFISRGRGAQRVGLPIDPSSDQSSLAPTAPRRLLLSTPELHPNFRG